MSLFRLFPLIYLASSGFLMASTSEPNYYGTLPGAIAEVKKRLEAGDRSLQQALDALQSDAEKALLVEPPSVTHKTKPGASGDLHDYASQAPYLWPDPNSPTGLPYITRDGQINPESRTAASDQSRVETLGKTVESLALAYAFTGEEKFAAHAARCLSVWFLDPSTKMNPHMNFAQAVPGRNTGRGIGIIEAGGLVEAADAAGLLLNTPSWTPEKTKALHAWLSTFLEWLRDSPHGRAEEAMKQNHGTMYDVRVARIALILGRRELAREIVARAAEKRIAVQIEPDGSQPMELRRTKSFNYSRLNLTGLCALASLGSWVGVDLWRFETSDGRSIRRALEFMLPYVAHPPKPWPYQQIVKIQHEELAGPFRQAALGYDEPRYETIVAGFSGMERARFQLLYPVARTIAPAAVSQR